MMRYVLPLLALGLVPGQANALVFVVKGTQTVSLYLEPRGGDLSVGTAGSVTNSGGASSAQNLSAAGMFYQVSTTFSLNGGGFANTSIAAPSLFTFTNNTGRDITLAGSLSYHLQLTENTVQYEPGDPHYFHPPHLYNQGFIDATATRADSSIAGERAFMLQQYPTDRSYRFTALVTPGESVTVGLNAFVSQIAYFNTVPEPAAWSLMIGGFGLIGGQMRRRRARGRFSSTAAG
jgi:hypothetical protein